MKRMMLTMANAVGARGGADIRVVGSDISAWHAVFVRMPMGELVRAHTLVHTRTGAGPFKVCETTDEIEAMLAALESR